MAALSDKVDEKILEKTPSDLRDEFIAAQESLEKQTKEIKEAVKSLEQKVSQALPRSQEKKDLKLQLEKERERLRKTEAEFQEKIYGNAFAFRDFFAGLLKDKYKLDISEEEMSNFLDEIGMRTTDAGYIEGTFNTPIKDLAEQAVAEYKESKGIKLETKKGAIKTAREAAIDMIRGSVERGDTLESLKSGLMGVFSDEYRANIGGYINGKNIGSNKIQVSHLNGKELAKPEIFSLEELYKEIKTQKKEKPKKEEKATTPSNLKVGQIVVIKNKKGEVRTTGEITNIHEKGLVIKDKEMPEMPRLYKDELFDFEPQEEETEMPDMDIPEDVEDEAQEDWEENFSEEYGKLADQASDLQKTIKEAPKKEQAELQKKLDAIIAKQEKIEEKFREKWQAKKEPTKEIDITKETMDERANALFIKRHGQEAYDEGVKQGAFGLERIEQFGREYDEVFLEEHPELEDASIIVYHDAKDGDDWAVLNTETGKFVEIFEKELLQPIDKEEKKEEDKANGKDAKNRRVGIKGKEVPEPIQVGGEKPGDIGGTAPIAGERNKNRPAKRGDKLGERLGARLTNEEIDKIVSSVAEISDNKVIKLTGEITEDILNAANQYTPGGTSKEGRGILDEYYTESQVVDMVKSLIDFPVKDLRVIEPSVGTGNFLYAIPEIGNHQVAALEINPITAKIAKIFHPSVKVVNMAFEELFITERGVKIKIEETNLADLIIGNPPYGEHRGKYLGLGEEKGITKYEDYFIKRGLDMLKEGGTLAMVVPSGFLDSGTDEVKQIITKNAELTKAYRLPVGIFKGTGIGTDIVIFKKKASASSAEQNNRLMQISRGRYFETNTNNVLGEIKERKNRFGKMEKYVDGDLSIAQSLFDQHRNDSKAKKILKNLKIEPTAENVEEAGEAIEESGDGAKEIIKEGEKAEKRLGKKIIKRVVKETVKKDDSVVPLTAQFAEISETESDLWKKTTSAGYVENPTAEEKKSLNYFLGNWYLDFNYLQGDIYEKLDTLEKQQGQISKEQYEAQKEKLEAVMPRRETLDDIKLSPNHTFVKDIVLGKDADDNDMTLRSNFLSWLGNLPRQAFGDSSNWEVRGYVNNEIVSGGDKDRNELTRVRRKIMAESLCAKFLKEDLDADDRRLVEETYNKTYNFYHTPDYSKVPMFSEIYSSFNGGKLKLNEAQKEGIGRLVNRGVGILAHEVGFGKTISGVLAIHETMERVWAKKPIIIVPNENVYNQWVKTIQELVPNAQFNLLGNLGSSYKGDLGSLKIADGSYTLVTYEGLKRLSFKDETYDKMAGKFKYIADDLTSHKTARAQAQEEERIKGIAGGMKKGTRADLFFEDLGFDHLTFDEVHNANHIVSKAKLEKGQSSDFSRFSIRPSDLGMKTWLASQYIQEKMNGRNINLLSATPFTNHPLEYYSVLSLVADKSLQKMRLENVNDFFGAFMEANNEYEFKADGSYKPKTDIRRIKNYRQWKNLLGAYIDFKQDAPGIKRPNRVQMTYEIPQNSLTQEMNTKAQGIFEENEKEAGKGAKTLRAINEFRKIAFSPYLSSFSAEVTPDKYKEIVENSPKLATVMGIIGQNKKDKPEAGQIIYSEVGVEFFPLLKNYLVKEVGFKTDEVELITGKTAKPTRITIQEKFNSGKIKVLIGSEAISEGMNLQQNTSDMHLLSLPWNFTALRQVIGRAWRQGNGWHNVRINQYFIQDSIDVFMSQKLDNKQRRYEAAIASDANEVDIGDVSYNEMKSELIQDPEKRAKFEIEAQKEKLKADIIQSKSELAFATRKLEKINNLLEEIKDDEESLAKERKEKQPNDFWIDRYTKNIRENKKEYTEELAKLKAKDIDVESLLSKKTEGEKHISELEAKEEAIDETYEARVKEIVATLPKREFFSQDTLDKFTAERAEHNKTFFKTAESPKEETIKVEKQVKEIKNAAGTKVVKKKTVSKAIKTLDVKPGTKDDRVLKILSDSSKNVAEKVNEILSAKQEGKEFKDIGERVSGSKKERAAINTVLENGDAAIIAEMIKTLGADVIAETLHKDEILENAVKPDVEKDKADKVPAFVAGLKQKVFNSIGRTPSLLSKEGRYGGMRHVAEEIMLPFLTNYGDYLRSFVKELAEIKNYEQATAFRDKYAYDFVDSIVPAVIDKDQPDYAPGVNIKVLGRTIKSAIDEIRTFKFSLEEIKEIKNILKNGAQKSEGWRDNKIRWEGFSYGFSTRTFDTKKEAEDSIAENRKEIEENLTRKENRLSNDYDYYLPKKKAPAEGTDMSHGNFKPLERVERSEPDIAEEKIKPETLTKEMGFKSVQLGNYMDDLTAKEHIRYTIGAVKDMSKLLTIDFPLLMNKMGLSIAFGARGGGRANAHYEPSKNIINLTKGKGDGSFFHEFVHFLDSTTDRGGYRKKWSSGKDRYSRGNNLDSASLNLVDALTGRRIRKVKEFIPREDSSVLDDKENWAMKARADGRSFEDAVGSAKHYNYPGRHFQDIADVYRQTVKEETEVYDEKTEFYKNAIVLGGNKTDSYWARPEELLARAGQAYIEDKMIEGGMKNNYLTRSTVNEKAKAYPQGEERKLFNKYFDEVFKELSARYPYKGEMEARFKLADFLYEQPETTMTEAGKYLADVKERLNLDFDVYFADSLLAGYKINPLTRRRNPVELWGAVTDNTILLAKELAKHTAPHEVVHLTLTNINKIPIFAKNGMTREKIMNAKAKQLGIEWNEKTNEKIDEALAYDFENYLDEKHLPAGLVRKFFAILKQALIRLARVITGTRAEIIKDYYEILDEGEALEEEYVRLENNGVVESFIQEMDGEILDLNIITGEARFKLKEEPDKRLQNLKGRFNDLTNKQKELEKNTLAWKTDLIKEIAAKEEAAKLVEETPERITGKFGEPGMIRFTTRTTPPPGTITARGEEEVESLGFANLEEAQQEINDYLQRKAQLISTRNKLRELRRQISQASQDKKVNKPALRDIERKLKMRKRYLEQKDYYVGMGVGRGKKEQMKMIRRRGRAVRDIQDNFAIGDKKAKEIIGGRKIHFMTEQEFNDFLVEFMNKSADIRSQISAQDELKAFIAENQLSKWENLQKAMGFPTVDKMTEQQAESFLAALSKYQFGDVFLTQRELETIHRTNWGEIKTERELLDAMQSKMGFSREELKNLTGRAVSEYTPWVRLARKHPFFNWLLGKRVEATVQAEREYIRLEEEINPLARAARASRRKLMGLKERAVDVAVPTDDIVFGFLEATDKESYEKKNKMTKEELAFAYYLIGQYWNAYEYLNSEYGMAGRQNYMTHTRRSFFEALKQEGIMAGLREVFSSQKEEEAAFKILDEETGNILAFEKFFGYALQRTGRLVPSKNVVRASLGYFHALAKKRAMDRFIPEAMVAVQAHKAVVGTTAKGLTKDPTLEKFVKEFLNDAKGRHIKFITRQGSSSDIALRAMISWVAIKYLGLNIASAIGNLFGDFTAIFWELNIREQARGVTRSIFHPIQSYEINKQFNYFAGRNPIVELFDPKYHLPARLKQALMVLMSLTSYQSNKFFLRAKMTDEEFKTGVLEDSRLKDIALSLSRVKPNKFYVKSLAGNTTAGTATFQFGSWAIAILNTFLSDGQEVIKMLAGRDVKKAITSREAQKLLKFGVMSGLILALTAFIDVDDDDYTLWGRTIRSIKNNLNTLVQALTFTLQYGDDGQVHLITPPVIKEITSWATALVQLFTLEEYKRDGKGYEIGDMKWIKSGERIITPAALRQFMPQEKGNAKESLIQEAIKTGVFNAEEIAKEISPDWNDPEKMDAEAKERKIASVKILYNARKNYPNDPVAEIMINGDNNEERIKSMLELGKTIGEEEVYSKLKKLYRDSELCADERARTGCLVSGKILKDYQIEKRKQ